MPPSHKGLRELFTYPLMSAIFDRRTRRVARGTSIVSGPISYTSPNKPAPLSPLEEAVLVVSTGLTGSTTLHDVPAKNQDGSPVHAWQDDDYFYHAQGYAAVMFPMMQAVKREYHQALTTKPVLAQLFDESIDPLGKAAMMKPLIVLDGSPDGVFANHRRNLDAYISEARQKMYSIREELER